MDWSIYNSWYDFLIKTEYKDSIIDRTIREFRRISSDQNNNKYLKSNMFEEKNNISAFNWCEYGKINNLLDKILKIFQNSPELKYELSKFNLNFLMLPRTCCKSTQKYQK